MAKCSPAPPRLLARSACPDTSAPPSHRCSVLHAQSGHTRPHRAWAAARPAWLETTPCCHPAAVAAPSALQATSPPSTAKRSAPFARLACSPPPQGSLCVHHVSCFCTEALHVCCCRRFWRVCAFIRGDCLSAVQHRPGHFCQRIGLVHSVRGWILRVVAWKQCVFRLCRRLRAASERTVIVLSLCYRFDLSSRSTLYFVIVCRLVPAIAGPAPVLLL